MTSALTMHYHMIAILEPNGVSRELLRKQVPIDGLGSGTRHRPSLRRFDELRRTNQATIIDNKHMGA